MSKHIFQFSRDRSEADDRIGGGVLRPPVRLGLDAVSSAVVVVLIVGRSPGARATGSFEAGNFDATA